MQARLRLDRQIRPAAGICVLLGLSGCSRQEAPTFILFGAYFPAWMLCALIGIVAAITARVLFVASGLSSKLPGQVFVCAAIGLMTAVIVWLLVFA